MVGSNAFLDKRQTTVVVCRAIFTTNAGSLLQINRYLGLPDTKTLGNELKVNVPPSVIRFYRALLNYQTRFVRRSIYSVAGPTFQSQSVFFFTNANFILKRKYHENLMSFENP